MPSFASCRWFVIGFALAVWGAHAAGEPPAAGRPLGLEEAVRLALEKNFQVRVEAFNPEVARANLTVAWGQYDPRLVGTYQVSHDEVPVPADPLSGFRAPADTTKINQGSLALEGALPLGTTFQIGGSTINQRDITTGYGDDYLTYAGISITQPLLRDFGLNPGMFQIRVARTNLAISEWEYRLALTNVITQVVYAYGDLSFARATLRSAERTRDMTVKLLHENEVRRDRGAMSDYDVLSARARVAERDASVVQAEHGVQLAENALKQLISDEHSPEFLSWHLALPALPDAPAAAPDAAADFRQALALRPDYRSARLGLELRKLELRYYRNQLLPRVDLQGGYGYNGAAASFPGSRTDINHQDYNAYTAGVSVSIPLAFAAERGQARAAKLRRRQAETDLQRLEQDILVSVSNAAQQVDATRRRVAATRTARELNERMLEAELKRLRAGTGSTFSVLYQQEQLSYAEIAAAQAEDDQLKALAEYDRQTGRTLSAHQVSLRSDAAISRN